MKFLIIFVFIAILSFLFKKINNITRINKRKGKSYVAVEPLVCDLVKSIALPSDKVTCLVDRKQDVHDLKINPRQAQFLNSADKVFTLGKEMTPSMRNWESKPKTVVIGVNAIDVDDHGGYDDHDDHSAAKVDDHAGHDDHDDHAGHDDHAEGSFEWAGTFELDPGTYKWTFAKVDGKYARSTMKMVILESGDIESSEELAKELLESDYSINKSNNDVLVATSEAYVLNFDQKKDLTVFNVDIKKKGKYTFFTEHMPFEFESDEHFFKDLFNSDVEPIAQVPDEDDHHHGHMGLDPHVWHNPLNIIKMANVISKNINKKISFFDRESKKVLNERTQKVTTILEELNNWIIQQVSTIPEGNRVIVTKHKAMEYYGNAFGLETVSLLDFLGDSSSLRPDNIQSTLKMLDKNNVMAIFPEQIPASKLLKNLSRQSSVPLANSQIFVDGLMMKGNLVSVAVHNTCTIVNSLGGTCDKKSGSKLESDWNKLTNQKK